MYRVAGRNAKACTACEGMVADILNPPSSSSAINFRLLIPSCNCNITTSEVF